METFIHMMSLAWKQLWVYPEGHPARAGAVGRAFAQLRLLVAPTGELALGIDRDALVCGGDRLTDTNAQQVAGQLFRRNVAVVRFLEGVAPEDLETWLALLHPDPLKKHTQRLWDEAAQAGVQQIEMEPVDFSGVEATEDLEAEVEEGESPVQGNLWNRILARLLESGAKGGPRKARSGGGGGLSEVVQLLKDLITEGEGEASEGDLIGAPGASDGETVAKQRKRRMHHLAEHLASAVTGHLTEAGTGERPAEADLRQVAELVKALPAAMRPQVLDAAVRRVAGAEDARGLELMAASSSAAAVVGSLRRLRGEDFSFSEHALSIVDALAWKEAGGLEREQELSEAQLQHRAHDLKRFFAAEDIDSVAGGGGTNSLLLELPPEVEPLSELPLEIENDLRSLSDQHQSRALSMTLLELIARAREPEAADPMIERLETVFATLVTEGQLTSATRIVEVLREISTRQEETEAARGAAVRGLRRLSGPAGTTAMVDYVARVTHEGYERPQKLVDAFDGAMLKSLLQALSEEEDMTRRKRLLGFLTALGSEVAGLATTALQDSRWFVVRNMLGLLRDVGGPEAVPAVRKAAGHENPKVRLEAIKTLAQLDDEPPRDLIEQLLADSDAQVAELATTTLAGRAGAGVDSLVALLQKKDPLGRGRAQRLKAFRTLGTVGDPRALKPLKRYFNQFFVFDHISERRAAFASLAGYEAEARKPWLKKGRKSKDPEIQAVCSRLWSEDQAGAN